MVGDEQHPLYAALTAQIPTADGKEAFRENLRSFDLDPTDDPDVLWNFEKFLIGKDGEVVSRFAPSVAPDDPQLIATVDEHGNTSAASIPLATERMLEQGEARLVRGIWRTTLSAGPAHRLPNPTRRAALVVGALWKWIFATEYGVANFALRGLGITLVLAPAEDEPKIVTTYRSGRRRW